MNKYYTLSRQDWEKTLANLIHQYPIYAPLAYNGQQDYELIDQDNISRIVYNRPKPATPLKTFFLPVEENVVNIPSSSPTRIIMGVPACDLEATRIQDEMYLARDYTDPAYKKNREASILIGTDCHSTQEHCHCTSYGIKPYPQTNHDLTLSLQDGMIYLYINSFKGESLVEAIQAITPLDDPTENEIQTLLDLRHEIEQELQHKNQGLPDYQKTGELVARSDNSIWKKYSETCVSCGACATICPTCTCFLLMEKPGFEKVRHLDACQYPGFEKVAAGEDPLRPLYKRFYNRYMCKYVWKPQSFESIACTGCGRCIEACIGNINKNELFLELANS
jgi:ferredoxin